MAVQSNRYCHECDYFGVVRIWDWRLQEPSRQQLVIVQPKGLRLVVAFLPMIVPRGPCGLHVFVISYLRQCCRAHWPCLEVEQRPALGEPGQESRGPLPVATEHGGG